MAIFPALRGLKIRNPLPSCFHTQANRLRHELARP